MTTNFKQDNPGCDCCDSPCWSCTTAPSTITITDPGSSGCAADNAVGTYAVDDSLSVCGGNYNLATVALFGFVSKEGAFGNWDCFIITTAIPGYPLTEYGIEVLQTNSSGTLSVLWYLAGVEIFILIDEPAGLPRIVVTIRYTIGIAFTDFVTFGVCDSGIDFIEINDLYETFVTCDDYDDIEVAFFGRTGGTTFTNRGFSYTFCDPLTVTMNA